MTEKTHLNLKVGDKAVVDNKRNLYVVNVLKITKTKIITSRNENETSLKKPTMSFRISNGSYFGNNEYTFIYLRYPTEKLLSEVIYQERKDNIRNLLFTILNNNFKWLDEKTIIEFENFLEEMLIERKYNGRKK